MILVNLKWLKIAFLATYWLPQVRMAEVKQAVKLAHIDLPNIYLIHSDVLHHTHIT